MIIDHAQRLNSLRTRLFRLDDLRRALLRRKFKDEIRLLSNFIPAGTFVADVGAHHGRMARELAVVHDGACRVLAFEPVVYNQIVAKAVLSWY